MRKFTAALSACALVLGVMSAGVASAGVSSSGNAANSLGKTTLDTTLAAGINYGSGIPDGEWITAETSGVEIGLRATDRTDGLLDVTGTNGNRVGVYGATTGFDGTTTNRAEWNYEFHVDLSRATGNAAGKTVSDYSLSLEQDFAPGLGTLSLPMPVVCDNTVATGTLCQQSWNPMFFSASSNGYDPTVAATYNLRLILTPETFSGPPLAVAIQVNVTAP